jgi:hypothetical protein
VDDIERTVELIPAYMFVCDECGRDNFIRVRGIEPESAEGRELAAFAEGVRRLVGGEVVATRFLDPPREVVCGGCGSTFAVDHSPCPWGIE